MALFTDGPISSMEDLTAQDSQLPSVASVEGIDVTQKLAAAQEQLALELHAMLLQVARTGGWFWLAPQPNIGCVAVTPALKLWHTYRTLEMVYADAYNSQLNDRYAGKRDQFHALAQGAREMLIELGLGIVTAPVPQAATPNVGCVPGDLPDNTYYVTMAWTNATGQEGAPAIPAAIATASSTVQVTPGTAPRNTTGWNVYAGTDPGAMQLQNESPIATGATWLQPGTVTTGGRAPGSGQSPSYVRPAPRILQRG